MESIYDPLTDIFLFLITCLPDIVLILQGEILSWSLMKVKGLSVVRLSSKWSHTHIKKLTLLFLIQLRFFGFCSYKADLCKFPALVYKHACLYSANFEKLH